jgi:AraC-like DNA-binding protein
MNKILLFFFTLLLAGQALHAQCPTNNRYYVDADAASGANDGTSWMDAYTDLQTALFEARFNGMAVTEIWVAEGTCRRTPYNVSKRLLATFGYKSPNINPFSVHNPTPKSTMLSVPNHSNEWLKRLNSCFETHISESNFTQQQLGQLMNISPRQLNRKIKKLTGMLPQQYFRQLRYEKAFHLLKERRYDTVAETAYAIGLKDVVHFSRQFRARYGKLTSEFLK